MPCGLPAALGMDQDDDLHSMDLRLLDRFGEVVVAGDGEEHVGGVVAGVGDQVRPDAQVHLSVLLYSNRPRRSFTFGSSPIRSCRGSGTPLCAESYQCTRSVGSPTAGPRC